MRELEWEDGKGVEVEKRVVAGSRREDEIGLDASDGRVGRVSVSSSSTKTNGVKVMLSKKVWNQSK